MLELIFAMLLLPQPTNCSSKFAFGNSIPRVLPAENLVNIAALPESLQLIEGLAFTEERFLGWRVHFVTVNISERSFETMGFEEGQRAVESDGVRFVYCRSTFQGFGVTAVVSRLLSKWALGLTIQWRSDTHAV